MAAHLLLPLFQKPLEQLRPPICPRPDIMQPARINGEPRRISLSRQRLDHPPRFIERHDRIERPMKNPDRQFQKLPGPKPRRPSADRRDRRKALRRMSRQAPGPISAHACARHINARRIHRVSLLDLIQKRQQHIRPPKIVIRALRRNHYKRKRRIPLANPGQSKRPNQLQILPPLPRPMQMQDQRPANRIAPILRRQMQQIPRLNRF